MPPPDDAPGSDGDEDAGSSISLPWDDFEGPTAWVLSILVGAIFGFAAGVFDALIQAGSEVAFAFGRAGEMFFFAGAQIAAVVLPVFEVPFDLLEGLAQSSGPFAPIVVAVIWFAAGAFLVGVVVAIWRFLGWL